MGSQVPSILPCCLLSFLSSCPGLSFWSSNNRLVCPAQTWGQPVAWKPELLSQAHQIWGQIWGRGEGEKLQLLQG